MSGVDWSPEQTQLYRDLSQQVHRANSWSEAARVCFEDAELRSPAPGGALSRVEESLGHAPPESMMSFYAEIDGLTAHYGTSIIMREEELIKQNLEFRTLESFKKLYMPFDNLLFFGEAGNGDLYGFPIMMNGTLKDNNVFRWDHEADSREWFASGLKDFLVRLHVAWSI